MATEIVEKQPIAVENLSNVLRTSGLLVHKQGVGHLDFQFLYLGYPFSVRAQSVDETTSINIRTFLGHLPYSSESLQGRKAATKILSTLNMKLGLEMELTRNQKIILRGNISSKETLSPVNLLTMVTTLLLQAKPMLELLSHYIKPSGEFAGLINDTGGIAQVSQSMTLN